MNETTQFFEQQNQQIKKHYKKLADNYNTSWTHSPEFVRAIGQECVKCLELKSTDLFVDIGCGTGFFTKEICDLAKLVNPALCVEPSQEMLEKLPVSTRLKAVLMDANDFIALPNKYDKILIKHAIHLIPNINLFLQQLYQRLNPKGILLLVIMSPQMEYPLFEAAFKKFNDSPPNPQLIARLVETAGFKTEITYFDYPITIEKTKYFQMIQNRFLTFLSTFNDREIEQGLEKLQQRYKDEKNLSFQEHYISIKAQK